MIDSWRYGVRRPGEAQEAERFPASAESARHAAELAVLEWSDADPEMTAGSSADVIVRDAHLTVAPERRFRVTLRMTAEAGEVSGG